MLLLKKLKEYIKTGEIIVLLILLSLPFTHIPEFLQKTGIIVGGYFKMKLLMYPIFLLFLYYILKLKGVSNKYFYIFLLLYSFISIISIIHALVIFPYYNELNSINDVQNKLLYLQNIIFLDDKDVLVFWITGRLMRSFIINTIFTFCVSYILFLIFEQKKFNPFYTIRLSVTIIVILMGCYSIIEILYLMKFDFAKDLLIFINPYIHIIEFYHGWFPPILLKSQLRSFFVEPSYLAMYGIVALPFLYSYVFENDKKSKTLFAFSLIFILSFCMFLTNSRSAIVFVIFDIMLLIVFNLFYFKDMKKNTCLIIICTLIAFLAGSIFSDKFMTNNKIKVENIEKSTNAIEQYVDRNINSIFSISKRSNRARYGVMYTDYCIGKDNLLLGVGNTLRSRYFIEYIPKWATEREEMKIWINAVKNKSMMFAGIGNFNEYLYRFSTTGILGLAVFLITIIVLLKKMINYVKNHFGIFDIKKVTCIMAFLASCLTGIGDSVTSIFWFWILLPLGYAMFDKDY